MREVSVWVDHGREIVDIEGEAKDVDLVERSADWVIDCVDKDLPETAICLVIVSVDDTDGFTLEGTTWHDRDRILCHLAARRIRDLLPTGVWKSDYTDIFGSREVWLDGRRLMRYCPPEIADLIVETFNNLPKILAQVSDPENTGWFDRFEDQ